VSFGRESILDRQKVVLFEENLLADKTTGAQCEMESKNATFWSLFSPQDFKGWGRRNLMSINQIYTCTTTSDHQLPIAIGRWVSGNEYLIKNNKKINSCKTDKPSNADGCNDQCQQLTGVATSFVH